MPGLPEAVAEFSFAAGLREHEDKWLQAEGFTELENCLQDKAGAVVKAPGWNSVAGAFQSRLGETAAISVVPEAPKLVRLGSQVGCVAGGYLFALRSDNTWVLQGRCPPWVMEQRTICDVAPKLELDYESTRHDACRCNDYVYSVFEYWGPDDLPANSRLAVAVTHLPTGKTLVQSATGAQSFGLTHPKIVPWGTTDKACLLYRREDTTPDSYAPVYYRQIDVEASSVVIGTEQPLAIAGSTPISVSVFDAVMDGPDEFGSHLWVAYHPSSAVSTTIQSVYVYRWTFGATDVGEATNGHQETGLDGIPHAVGISASLAANRTCVCWAEIEDIGSGNVRENVGAFKRTASLAVLGSFLTQVIWSSASHTAGSSTDTSRVLQVAVVDLANSFQNAVMFYHPNIDGRGGEFSDASPVTRGFVVGSISASTQWTASRMRLRSKPFTDGDRAYALMEYQGTDTTGLLDENRFYAVCGFDIPNLTGGRMQPYSHCANGTAISCRHLGLGEPGTDYVTAVWEDDDGNPCIHALERDPGTLRSRLRAYSLIADDRVGRSVEFGGAAYMAGSLLSMWDGLRVLEAAWLATPYIEDTSVTTNTPNQGAGSRYYRCTFARVNAAGELTRSRPSPAVQQVAASGERVDMLISPFNLSLMTPIDLQALWIEVWRTLDAQASPFYLIARIPLDLTNREVYTWSDTVSDSAAPATFGQLLAYDDQQGAELANDPSTPATHLAVHRGRLWLTDGEQLLYSKEQNAARTAEFSLLQSLPAPGTVAIGPLGDMLAVFRERGTAYVYGEGAAANGQGATLVGPTDLQTEHGCTAPAGVAVIPEGLLVPTLRGLQVLNQQRAYKLVGLAIEDTLAEFPRVRDAEWECGTSRVWVALCTEAGTRGIFGLWDLEADTWSVVRYSQQSGLGPSSIRSTPDALRWMTQNGLGRVPSETPGVVSSTHFNQLITTPWMKPAGALGEMRVRRVWLLGENLGTSPISIDVGYDFDETWTHTASFDEHFVGTEEPGDDTWTTGGTTPAVISDTVNVATVNAEGDVPHRVSGTADVEATDIGSYPVTVTALIIVDGVIAITGESHTFSSIPDSRTLSVSGTVRPASGQSIAFALEFAGNGPELPFPTSFELTNQVFTYEAEDALDNPVMLRIPTPKQRCHAVRFRVREDILSGDGSAGFRFVAMRVLTAMRGAKGALKGATNAGSGFAANGE